MTDPPNESNNVNYVTSPRVNKQTHTVNTHREPLGSLALLYLLG